MTYLLTAALAVAACGGDEDFVAPSFLHVDAMTLVPSAANPISPEPGFYSSEITSCYVEALYKGSNKMELLGLYQLPFTTPILHNGEVEYLVFRPVVKISGISGMQTYYTFYARDTVRALTFRSGDTVRLDTLRTTYSIRSSNVKMFESFEPTQVSTLLDSVEWIKHDPEGTLWGEGYGVVRVADTTLFVPFSITQPIEIYTSPGSSIVYLELDHRSDLPFEVYMVAQQMSGGSITTERVMMVNPSEKWQHMYITLGRTWQWFNYPTTFRLIFRALNTDGTGGCVRLDNVRVVTTTQNF